MIGTLFALYIAGVVITTILLAYRAKQAGKKIAIEDHVFEALSWPWALFLRALRALSRR